MKDFMTYLTETLDSIVNKKDKDAGALKALEELDAFIAAQNAPPSLPDRPDFSGGAPEYERLAVKEKTDEEIAKHAEDGLAGYQNSGLNAIEREIEALANQYAAQKENAAAAAEDKSASLKAAYEKAQKEMSDDVLKRGLARSSIAVNKQEKLSAQKADGAAKIGASLAQAVQKLDDEIAGLTLKREQALSDFNIAYAAKLTQTIHSLKEEQEKKKIEALKYNNTLTEKEHSAKVDAKAQEASVYGKELDNRLKEENLTGKSADDKSEAIYQKMTEILDRMSGNDARKLVMENAIFRDNLSDALYYKLYDRYAR